MYRDKRRTGNRQGKHRDYKNTQREQVKVIREEDETTQAGRGDLKQEERLIKHIRKGENYYMDQVITKKNELKDAKQSEELR